MADQKEDSPTEDIPTNDGDNDNADANGGTDASTLQAQLALLQRQLDDERRLRREAEDIIDQRQDEVYERDAQLRELRSKMDRRRKSKSRSRDRSRDGGSRERSGERSAKSGDDRLSPDTTTRQRGSSTKPKPVPATSPSPTIPSTISLPSSTVDPGLTRPQAMAAYAALIASVKSFVESRLAPVFALKTQDLEAAVKAVHEATTAASEKPDSSSQTPGSPTHSFSLPSSSSTYYTMSRPRALLRLMSPRARMFLRLKGADSVHFYAILMEFLRRRVFAEPYGGVFKTPTGPVPSLPIASPTGNTAADTNVLKEWLLAESDRRSVNKVEARVAEADELAARLGQLLNDLEPAERERGYRRRPTAFGGGGEAGGPSAPEISAAEPGTSPASATIMKEVLRPGHQYSASDGSKPVSAPPRRSSLRHEARLLRVQLLDRILANKTTSPTSPSAPATLATPHLSARVAGLSSYIDTRVTQLSADLARVFMPLQLALKTAMPASPTPGPSVLALYARQAVDMRAVTYASLEKAIATDVVRPAVELAVALQLAVPEFRVNWVEHANDSPSLSVCEALGLDYQRIQFGKTADGGSGDESQYSFVFDISPALYMADSDSPSSSLKNEIPIYAQGVLLQKGEVSTERTFVHWLHETGIKPKSEVGRAGVSTSSAAYMKTPRKSGALTSPEETYYGYRRKSSGYSTGPVRDERGRGERERDERERDRVHERRRVRPDGPRE